MATLKQIEANRLNARRSTGPRTPQGKAVASRNATTLGLFTRELLLVDEDPAELEALREEAYQQFRPAGGIERACVERYIAATWRLQRIMGAEVKILARWRTAGWPSPADVLSNPDALAELEKLQKHISSLERAIDRALNMLLKLKKRRERDDPARVGRADETIVKDDIEPNLAPGPAPESPPESTAEAPPSLEERMDDTTDELRAAARIEIVKSNPIPAPEPAPAGPGRIATGGG